MDDPVPVRRGVVGCLTIAILVVGVILLVRPTIFTLAPPRDDSAIVVAAVSELSATPIAAPVVLTRSYGWAGEIEHDDRRVELILYLSRAASGEVVALNAGNPVAEDCPVEIAGDRLADCDGRAWTFDGQPIDAADPPLERFPVTLDGGAVVVDLTRSVGD